VVDQLRRGVEEFQKGSPAGDIFTITSEIKASELAKADNYFWDCMASLVFIVVLVH
jgi:hypothetical protein